MAAASIASGFSADQQAAFDSMRKDIHSILITAKNGRDYRELEKDYTDLTGRPIPVGYFGFRSTKELIPFLSDIVLIRRMNGRDLLFGIPDAKTAHISKLVVGQKENKTSRFGGALPPEVLRKMLKENIVEMVSRSRRKALPIRKITADYNKVFKETAETQRAFGCNMENAIKQFMGDVLEVKDGRFGESMVTVKENPRRANPIDCWPTNRGVGGTDLTLNNVPAQIAAQHELMAQIYPNVPSAHQMTDSNQSCKIPADPTPVQNMQGLATSAASNSNYVDGQYTDIGSPKMTGQYPPLNELLDNIRSILSKYPEGVHCYHLTLQYYQKHGYYFDPKIFALSWKEFLQKHLSDICQVQPPLSPSSDPDDFGIKMIPASGPEMNSSLNDSNVHLNGNPVQENDTGIWNKLLEQCRSVLNAFPNGLPYNDFGKQYEELIGTELPLETFGYLALSELVSAATDIFELFKQPVTETIMVREKQTTTPSVRQNGQMSNDIGQTCHDVLRTAPDRKLTFFVLLRQINDRGCQTDFSGLQSHLLKNTDRFHCERDPKYNNQLLVALIETAESAMSYDFPASSEQNDIVRPGESFAKVTLPPPRWHTEKPTYEVTSTQFIKPDEFYVVLSENEGTILRQLMTEIKAFYESGENYGLSLRDEDIDPGLICCVPFLQFGFHRVKVIERRSDDDMLVFYVDYGTTDTVKKHNARYLLRKFFSLPAQALHCRLANAAPAKQEWDRVKAEELYQELTLEKEMSVIIENENPDGSYSVSVWLPGCNDTLLTEYVHNDIARDTSEQPLVGENAISSADNFVREVSPLETYEQRRMALSDRESSPESPDTKERFVGRSIFGATIERLDGRSKIGDVFDTVKSSPPSSFKSAVSERPTPSTSDWDQLHRIPIVDRSPVLQPPPVLLSERPTPSTSDWDQLHRIPIVDRSPVLQPPPVLLSERPTPSTSDWDQLHRMPIVDRSPVLLPERPTASNSNWDQLDRKPISNQITSQAPALPVSNVPVSSSWSDWDEPTDRGFVSETVAAPDWSNQAEQPRDTPDSDIAKSTPNLRDRTESVDSWNDDLEKELTEIQQPPMGPPHSSNAGQKPSNFSVAQPEFMSVPAHERMSSEPAAQESHTTQSSSVDTLIQQDRESPTDYVQMFVEMYEKGECSIEAAIDGLDMLKTERDEKRESFKKKRVRGKELQQAMLALTKMDKQIKELEKLIQQWSGVSSHPADVSSDANSVYRSASVAVSSEYSAACSTPNQNFPRSDFSANAKPFQPSATPMQPPMMVQYVPTMTNRPPNQSQPSFYTTVPGTGQPVQWITPNTQQQYMPMPGIPAYSNFGMAKNQQR